MGEIRDAFDAAVADNAKITNIDQATVAIGRHLADSIDAGDEDTNTSWMAPHLVNVLRELFATPAARAKAGVTDKESAGGTLASLRQKQDQRDKRRGA